MTPDLAVNNQVKYSNHKARGHDQHFVLYLPSPTHRSKTILTGCRIKKILFTHRATDTNHPQTGFNTSKIQLPTGAENHRTEIKQHGARRLISFNFSLQKDTRTGNQA